MPNIRSPRKFSQEDDTQKRDFSLFYSLLIHALLGFGLYYVSRPHIPDIPKGVEVTMVTPDMLKQMQQNAQKSGVETNTESDSSLVDSDKPINSVSTAPNNAVTHTVPLENTAKKPVEKNIQHTSTSDKLDEDVNQPSVLEALIEKIPGNKTRTSRINTTDTKKTALTKNEKPKPIFKPTSEKKGTIHKEKPKKERPKKTESKQNKSQEQLKAKQREEEALRKAIRERQKKADEAHQKEVKKQREIAKKKREQRLKDFKKREKEQDKEREKRRKAIQKAAKENAERIRKQNAENNTKPSKSKSLDKGKPIFTKGKAEKGTSNIAKNKSTSSQAGTTTSNVNISAIKNRFNALIKQRIQAKLDAKKAQKSSVTVKLRLSPSGNILRVRLVGSAGNEDLDQIFKDAVHEAAPLPVPHDAEIFNKFFKNVTLRLNKN